MAQCWCLNQGQFIELQMDKWIPCLHYGIVSDYFKCLFTSGKKSLRDYCSFLKLEKWEFPCCKDLILFHTSRIWDHSVLFFHLKDRNGIRTRCNRRKHVPVWLRFLQEVHLVLHAGAGPELLHHHLSGVQARVHLPQQNLKRSTCQ